MTSLSIKKINQIQKKKKRGFTLVELIIVIAIIAILAAMAIPKMGAVRDSANKKDDLAAAKNIATVIAQEIADGTIPTTDVSTATAIPSTVEDKLDGTKVAKATGTNKGKHFKYTLINENIKIYYDDGSTLIYPVS